jgi:hypothetical protein
MANNSADPDFQTRRALTVTTRELMDFKEPSNSEVNLVKPGTATALADTNIDQRVE